jgi:hypothetical protein
LDITNYFTESHPEMLNTEVKYKRITPEERRKQYVIGKELGKGAYGMVFSVKD